MRRPEHGSSVVSGSAATVAAASVAFISGGTSRGAVRVGFAFGRDGRRLVWAGLRCKWAKTWARRERSLGGISEKGRRLFSDRDPALSINSRRFASAKQGKPEWADFNDSVKPPIGLMRVSARAGRRAEIGDGRVRKRRGARSASKNPFKEYCFFRDFVLQNGRGAPLSWLVSPRRSVGGAQPRTSKAQMKRPPPNFVVEVRRQRRSTNSGGKAWWRSRARRRWRCRDAHCWARRRCSRPTARRRPPPDAAAAPARAAFFPASPTSNRSRRRVEEAAAPPRRKRKSGAPAAKPKTRAKKEASRKVAP